MSAARACILALLLVVAAQPAAATAPSAATGLLVAVRGGALVDGEEFTIGDGSGLTNTFEFDSNGSTTAGNVAVLFTVSDNAIVIANRITAAINSTPLAVTANNAGTAAVSLANDNAGSTGNVPIFEAVSAQEFFVSGMSGGTDAPTTKDASASTGLIVAVRAQWLVDGETFQIDDGAGPAQTFEFDKTGSVTPGNIAIAVAAADNASTVANKVKAAVNLAPLAVTASGAGTAAVWLVNDEAGSAGNVPIFKTIAAPEFITSGMSGGTDATVGVALPPADASVRAFPNPFRSTTLIDLGARARRPGVLRVLDLRGGVIRRFTSPDGLPSQVRWDGTDAYGRTLPPGIYLFEIVSEGAAPATGKFIKLR